MRERLRIKIISENEDKLEETSDYYVVIDDEQNETTCKKSNTFSCSYVFNCETC